MVDRNNTNRQLKEGLLVIGMVSSILGVISSSVALYLQHRNGEGR